MAGIVGIIVVNFFGLQLYTKGTFVKATVVESYQVEDGSISDETHRYYATYQYMVDGTLYGNKEQTYSGSLKEGDEILIRYQNGRPEKSCVVFGINIQFSGIFLGMIAVTVIVIVVRNHYMREQDKITGGKQSVKPQRS